MDILTTPVWDPATSKTTSDEEVEQITGTEQEFALDLTSHDLRDSNEVELLMETNQVLDLSQRHTSFTVSDAPSLESPEPNLVKQIKTSSLASTKNEFKIKTIGVRKRKPKYSFKCSVCDKTVHSIKEWNMHH